MVKESSNNSVKKIKDKALKLILNNEEITYESVISLSKNKKFDESKKLLNELIKKDFNEIYFLESITTYFSSLTKKKDGLGYDNQYKREVKRYIKFVKKSLDLIEKQFDEKHLLYYIYENKEKKYYTKYNAILLSVLDELSQILNHFGYNKEADKFFMIKGKVELGIHRYLFYSKENIILKSFFESGEYEIANNKERLEILSYYIIEDKILKDEIEKIKKSKVEKTEVLETLFGLKCIEKINEKLFKSEFKKKIKHIIYFPKQIIKKTDYDKKISISKSINKKYEREVFEIKTEKKILLDINSLEIANLILKIL
jgi:hypothetical protein